MTQNFKPSEFEELWGTKTIKISTSGASYNEVSDNIKRAEAVTILSRSKN